MPLADTLKEPPRSNRCRWLELIDTMPPDDREAAVVLMEGGTHEGVEYTPHTVKHIGRSLRANRYAIGDEALYLHRRRECSCHSPTS